MVKIYTKQDGTIIEVADANDTTARPEFWVAHEFEGTIEELYALLHGSKPDQTHNVWPIPEEELPMVMPASQSVEQAITATPYEEPSLSLEEWKATQIQQIRTAVHRLLAKSDWVEIRQLDPEEPTRLPEDEFQLFRSQRQSVRAMYTQYRDDMDLAATKEDATIIQKNMLIRLHHINLLDGDEIAAPEY